MIFFFKLRLIINQNIPGPVSIISNFRVFMKTNSFYFRGKKVNKVMLPYSLTKNSSAWMLILKTG